jgi:RimJ/RimL family protein N-acetyltransferase
MTVALRELEPRDLLAVGELATGALRGDAVAIADRLGAELLAGAVWGLVAERAGRIQGAAVVETDGPGRGHLTVAVARDARRRGIGTMLVDRVAVNAHERGLHKLVAQCPPGDRAALGLARAAGAGAEAVLRRHRRGAGGELLDLVALGLVLVPAARSAL